MRSKTKRRTCCAGHELGKYTRIIVFISTTRAAILMADVGASHVDAKALDVARRPVRHLAPAPRQKNSLKGSRQNDRAH